MNAGLVSCEDHHFDVELIGLNMILVPLGTTLENDPLLLLFSVLIGYFKLTGNHLVDRPAISVSEDPIVSLVRISLFFIFVIVLPDCFYF